jgi:ubiquinone/menaquinone biosynthesis C-methylase UbiE
MNTRKLYYFLSPALRLLVRRLYYLPIDLYEKLTGKRDALTPPRGMVFVGYGDFIQTGETLFNQIKEVCHLKPEFRVLDVGCGIGRLAVPLTKFINEKGSYEGFDIVWQGINWCTKHIKPKYPNFNFLYVDLKNDLYNLKTRNEAKDYIFPYKDNEFDLIILTSVFTHMLPADISNYLNQIHRVLKKDGKCFATFFLLNQEIKASIEKRDHFNFPYIFDNYRLFNKNVKEANVAYEESFLLLDLFPKNNLIADKIYYGWWSGKSRDNSLGYQDTIILTKKIISGFP